MPLVCESVVLDGIDLPADYIVLSGNKAAHWFIGSRQLPFACLLFTAVSGPPETYSEAQDKVSVKLAVHLHRESQEHYNVYIEEIKEATRPLLIKRWHTAWECSVNKGLTYKVDVCSFFNLCLCWWVFHLHQRSCTVNIMQCSVFSFP